MRQYTEYSFPQTNQHFPAATHKKSARILNVGPSPCVFDLLCRNMASSASAALLLLLLRFQGCLSSSARVSMLRRATVPASDWTVGETHSNKGETRMTCAARAITGGWYFSSLDASQV